jgi:hypothetical protein
MDSKSAEAAMAAALKRINEGGQAAENAYGAAYQQLVRMGKAPQLRRKYRSV